MADNYTKIWLSSPHMGGSEQKYVQQAFDENWIAPLGPNVNGFEQELQNYLHTDKKIASLSSGTAAIHLALRLLDVGENDVVICQSFTFIGTTNPIIYQGAIPVFVDSERYSLNIDYQLLEEAIKDQIQKGKKPKAILAVHLYGNPYQVDEVHQVASKYNIPVIEDAAEALGSTYKNQYCGGFGDFGILSFNGNKIITTSGGGAIICPDEESKKQAVFLATQAKDPAPHYQHSQIGYNYRLSNLCAGVGRGQLEVLDKHVKIRREINKFYKDLFSATDEIEVFETSLDNVFCNNWLSLIYIHPGNKLGLDKNSIMDALNEKNIESRPLWKPMHLQPIYKGYEHYGNGVCDDFFDNGLCLPSGSNMTTENFERIKTAFKDLLDQ